MSTVAFVVWSHDLQRVCEQVVEASEDRSRVSNMPGWNALTSVLMVSSIK